MLVTSIEREVGSLPLAKELIKPRSASRTGHTREQALAAPPQPEAPVLDAAGMLGEADVLAEAHSLDQARVAALLADPLG